MTGKTGASRILFYDESESVHLPMSNSKFKVPNFGNALNFVEIRWDGFSMNVGKF